MLKNQQLLANCNKNKPTTARKLQQKTPKFGNYLQIITGKMPQPKVIINNRYRDRYIEKLYKIKKI